MFPDFHTHVRGNDVALVDSPVALEGEVAFSLELHPWKLPAAFSPIPETWQAALPRAAAVGEIGLDRLRGPELAVQRRYLAAAAALAAQFNKPVVIHSVRADDEVREILSPYPQLRKLVHGFRGNRAKLERWLEAGYFVSCAEIPPSALPLDRLALESDEHPEKLEALYRDTAAARKIGVTELQIAMYRNFMRFLTGVGL